MKTWIGRDGHGIERTSGKGKTSLEAYENIKQNTLAYILENNNADDYKTWRFREKT